MTTIELHELKDKVSEVLHRAQRQGETIQVTEGGTLLALIMPMQRDREGDRVEGSNGEVMDVEALVAEISAHWPRGVSAVDAIRDGRD
ncbi:MAG: hypothetical protein M3014_00830 [Chloroflexota bacterium]|nr:hypothetical protein [Chloroflexota bacterium]